MLIHSKWISMYRNCSTRRNQPVKWSNLSDTRGLFASNQMKTRPRKGMWGAECSLNRVKCKMNDPPRSNINNEPCQTPRLPGSRLRFLILASSILSSLWAWKVKPWSIASIYLYSYQTQYQWRLIDVVLEMSDFGSPTAQQGWLNIHREGNTTINNLIECLHCRTKL